MLVANSAAASADPPTVTAATPFAYVNALAPDAWPVAILVETAFATAAIELRPAVMPGTAGAIAGANLPATLPPIAPAAVAMPVSTALTRPFSVNCEPALEMALPIAPAAAKFPVDVKAPATAPPSAAAAQFQILRELPDL